MALFHLFGMKTFSVYNDPLFDELGASDTVGQRRLPASLEEMARSAEPFFIKTHELPQDGHRAVYLVRDGRDTLVSCARYLQAYGRRASRLSRLMDAVGVDSFRYFLRRLIGSDFYFGGWSRHVLAWTDPRRQETTTVLRFQDLLQEPQQRVERLLRAVHIEGTANPAHALPPFEALQSRWPKFFRKGRTDTWQEEMPDDLHELFWRRHAQGMAALGYARGQ